MAKRSLIEKAIKTLHEYHRVGSESLSSHPDRMPYGSSRSMAKKAGMKADLLGRTRMIAHAFSAADLALLCDLARLHAFALNPSHLLVLVPLKKRPRMQLARRAIEHGWSRRKLVEEARKKRPADPHRGRKPAIADDAEGQMVQLASMCVRWRRWRQAQESAPRPPAMPLMIRRLMAQVDADMAALEKALPLAMNRKSP